MGEQSEDKLKFKRNVEELSQNNQECRIELKDSFLGLRTQLNSVNRKELKEPINEKEVK